MNQAETFEWMRAEISRLTDWKDSAMTVLGRWDKVFEYVRTNGGRLGHDGSAETLRILQELEAANASLKQAIASFNENFPEQTPNEFHWKKICALAKGDQP